MKYWALALILVLAAAVRLYGLASESLWADEAFSVYNAQQPLAAVPNFHDVHPPLYALTLSLFVKLFGTGEFWVRLPSVIFGVLSVFLIYLLAKKLFNGRTALIASLMLAVASYHVYYSQEARMYSLMGLLTLASMLSFFTYSESPRPRNAAAYVLATALLIYTHVFGLLLVMAQNAAFFGWARKGAAAARRWMAVQLCLLLALAPLASTLLHGAGVVSGGLWITNAGLWLSLSNLPGLFSGGVILGTVYGALLLIGIIRLVKRRFPGHAGKFRVAALLLWTFLPTAALVFYSLLFTPVFFHRYVMFSSLGAFVLIAYALSTFRPRLQYAVLLLAVALSMAAIAFQAQNIDKEQWPGVAKWAGALAGNDTAVILSDHYNIFPFSYYYSRACFSSPSLAECMAGENVFIAGNDFDLPAQFVYIGSGPDDFEGYEFISEKEFLAEPHKPMEDAVVMRLAQYHHVTKRILEDVKKTNPEITIFYYKRVTP